MTRPKRSFKTGFCYHVTVRCNNREFWLMRDECREFLLYAIQNRRVHNARARLTPTRSNAEQCTKAIYRDIRDG